MIRAVKKIKQNRAMQWQMAEEAVDEERGDIDSDLSIATISTAFSKNTFHPKVLLPVGH